MVPVTLKRLEICANLAKTMDFMDSVDELISVVGNSCFS